MAHRKTERLTPGAAEEEARELADDTLANRASDREPAGREGQMSDRSTSGSREGDNRAEGSEPETAGTDEAYDRMKRAEEMVDRVGERVGYYTTQLGHQLLRWAARAREEVEDMVAEAQSLRQRKQP